MIVVDHRRRRRIESGAPVFVIAEAGVNHNGDARLAEALVDAAATAGADAVKFQTFRAAALVTAAAPQAAYQRRRAPARSQLAMLQRLELSEAVHKSLIARARRRGLCFLSTPFDEGSARLLHELGVPLFKIGSGDLTNLPFLAYVARFGRPIILSTGMSTLDEVRQAVRTIRRAGNPPLALLQCVSSYPARVEDVNLRAMATLERAFRVPVGLSDHTAGTAVSIAAAGLGATIIEKHLTMNSRLAGPDHAASLEPSAFAAMVAGIRDVERALGSGVKAPVAAEREVARVARRSVVAAVDIPRGARIARQMLACKRPGSGIPPSRIGDVVGRRAARLLAADHVITAADLAR
jgi:N,N'-diacetyllegionaminate synthase